LWFNLAETYFELGEWIEALKAFDECIRIKPKDAASFYSKAKANFVLSRTKEAIECLKTAFLYDPSIRSEFEQEYPEIKSSKLFRRLLGEI
ncbi:MAG TPA: tetratricopeptide repeat protein, partial [Ignavibacteriaceae bacterium]|nr:tetratricopeptide repeat protein [Ignavibacteriaceae bacterium]